MTTLDPPPVQVTRRKKATGSEKAKNNLDKVREERI